MSRPLADYVALALLSKVAWNDNEGDIFSQMMRSREFTGDVEQLRIYAEERTGFPVSAETLHHAMRLLGRCGLLRITEDTYSGTFVKLKGEHFHEFFRQADKESKKAREDDDEIGLIMRPSDYPNASVVQQHELLADYAELGDEWLKRALAGIRVIIQEHGAFPSDDRTIAAEVEVPAAGRLVTVLHNSPEFEEVVAATEDASDSIRAANSLDEERRGWIRRHIEAGLVFLKSNRTVLASAVFALILQPLQNAYDAVTEEPARIAIMAAIDAITKMFGL